MAERDKLFELAVARALSYTQKLGLNLQSDAQTKDLEPWYLKTRFAYRIPLDDIIRVLQTYPGQNHHWKGGKDGTWVYRKVCT